MNRVRWAAALAAVMLPAAAPAHEVLHTIERSRAVAVQATYADGEPLANVPYDVFGPGDPDIPHQRGRADRQGWVAFVPDAPGNWRVRLADDSGHGLDLTVEVDAEGIRGEEGRPSALAFALRPLVGTISLGVLFFGLYALIRRRQGARS